MRRHETTINTLEFHPKLWQIRRHEITMAANAEAKSRFIPSLLGVSALPLPSHLACSLPDEATNRQARCCRNNFPIFPVQIRIQCRRARARFTLVHNGRIPRQRMTTARTGPSTKSNSAGEFLLAPVAHQNEGGPVKRARVLWIFHESDLGSL